MYPFIIVIEYIEPPLTGQRREGLRYLLQAVEGENHLSHGTSKYETSNAVCVCVLSFTETGRQLNSQC